MRVFLAVLFLIFSLQSWTKADDISDFQIEGMSIGDSALDYFSEKEIKAHLKDVYSYKKDKTFVLADVIIVISLFISNQSIIEAATSGS